MSHDGGGSHVPLLASVVAIARPGPVLELGVGDMSTPLLREMCRAMGRELVSVDTSPPPSRLELVKSMRERAEFIVIHDTDNQGGDLTELVAYLEGFRHARVCRDFTPWTTVVSDTRGYPS